MDQFVTLLRRALVLNFVSFQSPQRHVDLADECFRLQKIVSPCKDKHKKSTFTS